MWIYEKKLQYPVKIARPNAALAKVVITQFGGPDGELGAANRYLAQRFSCPYGPITGTLTDIGTEELGHVEMICSIVHQLTRDLTIDEIKKGGFSDYFVDHTTGVYPVAASGVPFNAATFQSKGDILTDLHEDMAADGTSSHVLLNAIFRFIFIVNKQNIILFNIKNVLLLDKTCFIIKMPKISQLAFVLNLQILCQY